MEFLLLAAVLLLISVAMSMDMSWNNVLTSSRNEMVFADRHQDYGAYVLRRDYVKWLAMALGGSVVLFALTLGTPKIIAALGAGDDGALQAKKIVDVNLELFEEDKKEEPPPPPIEPPPQPKIETVEFTALEAVDEPVEEPPPTQEQLSETVASTVSQEGEKVAEAPPPVESESQIFTIVEEMPQFPGGEAELYKFLRKVQEYPQMAVDAGIQGTVYVTFEVDRDGKVKKPRVLRGLGGGLDEAAIRMVNKMPAWEPGKQRGEPVRVQYNLPIRFTLK